MASRVAALSEETTSLHTIALNLSSNGMGDYGTQLLATFKKAPLLGVVILNCVGVTGALCVMRLDLIGNRIGKYGTQALTTRIAFPSGRSLRIFSLSLSPSLSLYLSLALFLYPSLPRVSLERSALFLFFKLWKTQEGLKTSLRCPGTFYGEGVCSLFSTTF